MKSNMLLKKTRNGKVIKKKGKCLQKVKENSLLLLKEKNRKIKQKACFFIFL